MFGLEGHILAQSKCYVVSTCPETLQNLQVGLHRTPRGCLLPKFPQPGVAKPGFPDAPLPSKSTAAKGHVPEEPQNPPSKTLYEFCVLCPF